MGSVVRSADVRTQGMDSRMRVVIADDHAVSRRGLALLFADHFGQVDVAEVRLGQPGTGAGPTLLADPQLMLGDDVADRSRADTVRAAEADTAQVGRRHVDIFQRRAAELRAFEPGAGGDGTGQVGARQVGAGQVGAGEVGIATIHLKDSLSLYILLYTLLNMKIRRVLRNIRSQIDPKTEN